jgi:hypothetical protein
MMINGYRLDTNNQLWAALNERRPEPAEAPGCAMCDTAGEPKTIRQVREATADATVEWRIHACFRQSLRYHVVPAADAEPEPDHG